MSTPPKTSAESDAILAACYVLAMQSSYIGESIEESLTPTSWLLGGYGTTVAGVAGKCVPVP
jgi:hypothetical protein